MSEFFSTPQHLRRFFAITNLVPALVLGLGCKLLPVRWWPLDSLIGVAVVLLLATTAIALFDARRADRALFWAAAGLLAIGLVVVGAFALSMAFLSGVHGPFGAFGVALMGLVVLLLLPYAVIYPALALMVFRARTPRRENPASAAEPSVEAPAAAEPGAAATASAALDIEAGS